MPRSMVLFFVGLAVPSSLALATLHLDKSDANLMPLHAQLVHKMESAEPMCTNTCMWNNDDLCDDGGPGSLFENTVRARGLL